MKTNIIFAIVIYHALALLAAGEVKIQVANMLVLSAIAAYSGVSIYEKTEGKIYIIISMVFFAIGSFFDSYIYLVNTILLSISIISIWRVKSYNKSLRTSSPA